jgi:hypothetical protein
MSDPITSNRGEPADALELEGRQGHGIQDLTPAETARVSGGMFLLYWLLTQPAY